MFPLKLNAQEVMGCSIASEVWEGEREGDEGGKNDQNKIPLLGMGATDLQFGAGIFIPEAKSPVRPDSCQCTVDGVKRDGIYLGGRRGEGHKHIRYTVNVIGDIRGRYLETVRLQSLENDDT